VRGSTRRYADEVVRYLSGELVAVAHEEDLARLVHARSNRTDQPNAGLKQPLERSLDHVEQLELRSDALDVFYALDGVDGRYKRRLVAWLQVFHQRSQAADACAAQWVQ